MLSKFWNQESSPSYSSLHISRNSQPSSSNDASPSRAKAPSPRIPITNPNRPSTSHGDSVHSLSALNRYESDIQRRFQTLLDAQAERLLAVTVDQAFDAQSASDVASSSATDDRVPEHGKVIPVRQPAPQRLSLRSTRREIGTALKELFAIKEQERQIYVAELRKREETASRITAWENRREGLNKEINIIQSNDRQSRIEDLSDQNSNLQEQIFALENQLMELKSQQNAVKLELSQLQNAMQSKLSSYTESLRILESDIQQFLAQSPSAVPDLSAHGTSYQSLPPSRRTLKLASEHTQEDMASLRERFQVSKEEGEATQEGQIVWRDVVLAVTELEQHMRQHLAQDNIDRGRLNDDSQPRLINLLEEVDGVIMDLDSKLRLSDARGWKLLVCCIGAELDALQKGRVILADTISGHSLEPRSPNNAPAAPYKESLDAEVMMQDRSNTRTGPFSRWASDSATASPTRRSSESVRRRSGQMETKHIHIPKEGNGISSSSPPLQTESGGETSLRRSIDSFRRRNERSSARIYRPEDDEPAPDLLITEPDPIDS